MDSGWLFGCYVVLIIFIAVMFLDLGEGRGKRVMEQEAITRGYASFCPLDGAWAWNGECKGKE